MYLQGQGVPKDSVEAARWIRKAAEQGSPRAQVNLGALFAEGLGAPKNFQTALFWYRRAAEQGDAESERNLGSVYAEGKIARADYVEACKWFSLAAAQGDETAADQREQLARKMTPRQIAEGQRLAAAFVPRKEGAGLMNSPKASGTGFFVTGEGHFVTAGHVVEGASNIVLQTKLLRLAAQVIKTDKTNDLALLRIIGALPATARITAATNPANLLKVAANFHALAIVDSGGLKLGDPVSTLGFPNIRIQGTEPKFTRGEINSLAGIKDDPNFFQISAPVQPGNSGGPLLDRFGNVVGMVEMTLNDLTLLQVSGSVPQNVNYALKSGPLLRFLNSVPAVAANLKNPQRGDGEAGKTDWLSEAQQAVAVVLVY
jgi:uncharacterized protein